MKKITTAWIVIFCMMLSIAPLGGTLVSALSENDVLSYGFMSGDKVINALTDETSVYGYIDVQNSGGLANPNVGKLVLACYATNNGAKSLLAIKSVDISLAANTNSNHIVTSPINVPSETEVTFKVFVMNGLQNICPTVNMKKMIGISEQVETDATLYSNEINVGESLNILKGSNESGFERVSYVSRDEFVADIVRLLGKKGLADMVKGTTAFSDVSADNWASGYINLATNLGYIKGYEDGKFYPNVKITYYQTLRVLVDILGYKSFVNKEAREDIAYLDVAYNIGLINGIDMMPNDLVSAGVLAKIINNSLDIPIVINSVVQDGYGDTTRKTIMSENLNIVKLMVEVNSSSLLESGSQQPENVEVTILNNYRTKYSDEFADGRAYTPTTTNYKIDVGSTNLSSLVGRIAIVYVLYNPDSSNNPVALYAKKDTTNTYEVTISTDSIVSAAMVYYGMVIEYFEKPDDRLPTSVTLSEDTKIYINGALSNSYSINDLVDVYGEITLTKLDSSISEDYDTVYVTDYTDFVVDVVNKNTSKVTAKNAVMPISFSPTDASITAILYDDKDVKMDWNNLKEWDVLSVQVAQGINKIVYKAQLVKNSITGKITGVIEDTDVQSVKYEIGGKEYKIDPKGMQLSDLYLGDEGTFYLDILGRIAWYDTTPLINGNYGFVQNIVAINGLTSQPEMKIFNSKGEFQTLKVATTVKIDGIGNIKSDVMFDANDNALPLTKSMTLTDYNAIVARYGAGFTSFANGTVTIDAVVPGDFITFKTNSSNEVTEIDRATSVTTTADVRGKFTQYGSSFQPVTTYTAASNSLTTESGRVYLTDKTIIMVATPSVNGTISTNDNDYYIVNPTLLEDGQLLESVTFYNVDGNKNVSAILVNSETNIPHDPTVPESPIIKTTTAYIQNIVPIAGLTMQPEMKVLDIDGRFKIYKVATTVKIDGVGELRSGDMFDFNEMPLNLTKAMTQSEYDSIVGACGGGYLSYANGIITIDAVVPSDIAVLKINSNNEVAEIDRETVVSNTADTLNKFTQYGTSNATSTYSLANKSFTSANGAITATDSTKIFIAPSFADDEKYAVCDITKIPNGQILQNVRFLNVDVNKNASIILVESDSFMPEMPPIPPEPVVSTTAAFIQNIVPVTGLTSQPEMKIFNSNGEFQVFKIATTVKIDGVTGLTSEAMFDANDNAIDLTKTIAQSEYDNIVAADGGNHLAFGNGTVTVEAVEPGQFAIIKINSYGEVVEIDRSTNISTSAVNGGLTQYGVDNQNITEYTKATHSFNTNSGIVYMTDKTAIMVAPPDDYGPISFNDDDYQLFNIASLEDEQIFEDVTFYSVDENKNVGYILVRTEPAIQPSTAGFFAVGGYSQTSNAEGDLNYTVKGLKDGVAVSIPTTTELATPPAPGSVVLPVKNASGEVKSFFTLATISWNGIDTRIGLPQLATAKNLFYFGKIKEIRGRNVTLFDATEDAQSEGSFGLDIVTLASTNVYVYDMRVSTVSKRLTAEDINYVDVRLATASDVASGYAYAIGDTIYEDAGLPISSMSIFAREYEGKIVDVVLYIFD